MPREGFAVTQSTWLIVQALALTGLLATTVAGRETIVVMLGDSTTSCERNSAGKKLTELVAAKLAEAMKVKPAELKVINSGVGGSTAKEGAARVQTAVIAHQPDVVTISFGLNDTGRSNPEEFRHALETIVDAVQQKTKARIFLLTSTPFDNARHAWKDKFAAQGGLDETLDTKFCAEMRELAKKRKLSICDLHASFKQAFAKDPALLRKVLLSDGVHLTDEGNDLAAGFIVAEFMKK
jgi:lysophospholipase L1-like esterase